MSGEDTAPTAAARRGRRWLPQWRPRNVGRLFVRAVASFRPLDGIDHHAAVRLQRAERRGLQLSVLCRTVGFAIAFLFYVLSLYLSGAAPTATGVAILAALTGIGIAHFIVMGTRLDRPWIKFVVSTIDVFAICALVAVLPVTASGEVPQTYSYTGFNIHLLFPFLALAALSFSPRLVLWVGIAGVIGWWGAFALITRDVAEPLSWSSLPSGANFEEFAAVVLSPDFVGRGSRMVETLTLFITAAILSLAVARARHIFVAQVRAEEEREREREARSAITRQLGRFVPSEIAQRLIDNPSGLTPQVRHGAVLVMDIRDFTATAEGRDPAKVISELNTFLAQCADVVAAREGVVISFTGDGLLATFNTPLDVREPEKAALAAAMALLGCAAEHGLFVRVGLAAGPIVAGSVGSAQRQAFTVYGDTVNRAARLEALAKELQEQVLADSAMRTAVLRQMRALGPHRIRGFSEDVPVFAVEPSDEVVGAKL